MIRVNVRGDATGEWLERSIRHLVSEANSGRPGGTVLLSKMAEALFIETLRRYMEQMPPQQAGWLAAARDPVVGAALALLHRKPCHSWTTTNLSAAVGASRSVLAERFTRLLGEPPLTYLARWRMQLAARKLQMTRDSIVSVGLDVGYESEAAFSRAFKREFGLPPARYRRNYLGQGIAASRRERPDRNGGLLR
jgi:AraC-like DNA-binding protein